MKGRILGTATIDAAGAITGEDGQRYRYGLADWRGERAATPGVSVDFEIEAGEAKEVYPAVGAGVLGGALGGAPMPSVEQLSSSPVMAKVKSLFTNTLAFPLAVVVLIAFFLPAMSSPVKSVSQWGLGGVLGEAQLGMLDTEGADRRLGQIEEQLARYRQQVARSGRNASDGAYGYGSIGERIDNLEEERAELRQARGKVGFLKAVQAALLLRFAALAGAVWLLWVCWAGRSASAPSLAVGAAAVVAGALPFLFKSALIGVAGGGMAGEAIAAGMDAMIKIGVGPWLLAAAGIGLVVAGLGLVRNPLARA